jgi:hypothetical protein
LYICCQLAHSRQWELQEHLDVDVKIYDRHIELHATITTAAMRATHPIVAVLSALLPSVAAIPTNTPIFLGDIFHPPSMYILAFLPGEVPCDDAIKIAENKPFSIGGIDGIVLKSYWGTQAISPESVYVDSCPVGRRERLTGIVKRTWSCYVVGDGKGNATGEIPAGEEGGSGTRAGPNRPYWEN